MIILYFTVLGSLLLSGIFALFFIKQSNSNAGDNARDSLMPLMEESPVTHSSKEQK